MNVCTFSFFCFFSPILLKAPTADKPFVLGSRHLPSLLSLVTVTCNFVQKTGAGMHTAATALWDAAVDGKHTVLWESQTIQCIVSVYWLAI